MLVLLFRTVQDPLFFTLLVCRRRRRLFPGTTPRRSFRRTIWITQVSNVRFRKISIPRWRRISKGTIMVAARVNGNRLFSHSFSPCRGAAAHRSRGQEDGVCQFVLIAGVQCADDIISEWLFENGSKAPKWLKRDTGTLAARRKTSFLSKPMQTKPPASPAYLKVLCSMSEEYCLY